MQIRKLFKVESSHIVRNCSTERCKESLHGHSGVVEVFLTSDKLDNGGMIVDFSLIKRNVGKFIDSFDHCCIFWNKDNSEYITDMKKWSNRWIELPISPSAENFALYMCYVINKIIEATQFNNGEGKIECSKVIYHETTTGYAEATKEDLKTYFEPYVNKVGVYSEGVQKDWSIELRRFIADNMPKDVKYFNNPIVKQQV